MEQAAAAAGDLVATYLRVDLKIKIILLPSLDCQLLLQVMYVKRKYSTKLTVRNYNNYKTFYLK